jgi:hypothetical protein
LSDSKGEKWYRDVEEFVESFRIEALVLIGRL